MTSDEKTMLTADSAAPSNRKVKRRRIIIIGSVMGFIAIALAVGLGVGLTVGRPTHNRPQPISSSSPTTSPPSTSNGGSSVPASVWKPTAGMSWQYDLRGGIPDASRNNIEVHDIDLFDNSAETIAQLQQQGAKVICYFSAGSYEDWRPDQDQFQPEDLGGDLNGWAGEKWLKTSSPNVRRIMESRLDMAVQKKCDGVDPDNLDGYDNDENGLGLTEQDSIDYITFLAKASHDRNLAVGLKNAGSIIPDVLDLVQFSVNEQCQEWNECDTYRPFIDQGKPVFHVEYPKGDDTNNEDNVSTSQVNSICGDGSAQGFSTIIKNMDLDQWIQECPQ